MPSSHVKLILTDIDETVLPRGASRVSDRTVAAMHAAMDAGIRVGPASGRGIEWIPPFFGDDAECCATCLATNGLQVYLDGSLVHQDLQPRAALEELAELVARVPGAGLLCFDGVVPLLVEGSRDDLFKLFPQYAEACRKVDRVPDEPLVKANVFIDADEAGTRELLARLGRELPALDFDYAFAGYSNVMPHGRNKGSGIVVLCDLLDIRPDQVVVFGDAGNDLAMFAAVENSVAVANAQEDAFRAARWHIGRCADDAVAEAVERLAAGEWPFTS